MVPKYTPHDRWHIERWNGTRFAGVTQPVSPGYLSAVTVVSRTSAYAVGETGSGTTLVEHYNGTRWTRVSTPSPAGGAYLSSVAAALAQVTTSRDAPVAFMPINLPEPFEHSQAVRLRYTPEELPTPPPITPRTPAK